MIGEPFCRWLFPSAALSTIFCHHALKNLGVRCKAPVVGSINHDPSFCVTGLIFLPSLLCQLILVYSALNFLLENFKCIL